MNPFNDLTPPSMDETCITGVTSTICSRPWDYYKANTVDVMFFLAGAIVAYAFITKR